MERNAAVHETSKTSQVELAEDYRQMAADQKREAEAEEWSEALIGDVASDEEEGLYSLRKNAKVGARSVRA